MNTLVTLLLATQAFVSLSLAIGMAFRESTYIRENAMMILHMLLRTTTCIASMHSEMWDDDEE